MARPPMPRQQRTGSGYAANASGDNSGNIAGRISNASGAAAPIGAGIAANASGNRQLCRRQLDASGDNSLNAAYGNRAHASGAWQH